MTIDNRNIAVYNFSQGETISIALDNVEGDISQVSSVSCSMKFVEPGRKEPLDDAEVTESFLVIDREATEDIPEGWTLTIDSTSSSNIPTGRYMVDAKINIGSSVQITDPIYIDIQGSITQ